MAAAVGASVRDHGGERSGGQRGEGQWAHVSSLCGQKVRAYPNRGGDARAIVNDSSTTEIRRQVLTLPPHSWLLGAGYLTLYLLLDWASYVQPLRHTSITPWNPNTGVVMALLLTRGWRWAPLVAFGIFTGEFLTAEGPPSWWVLTLTSLYLAAVYACAAGALRR